MFPALNSPNLKSAPGRNKPSSHHWFPGPWKPRGHPDRFGKFNVDSVGRKPSATAGHQSLAPLVTHSSEGPPQAKTGLRRREGGNPLIRRSAQFPPSAFSRPSGLSQENTSQPALFPSTAHQLKAPLSSSPAPPGTNGNPERSSRDGEKWHRVPRH